MRRGPMENGRAAPQQTSDGIIVRREESMLETGLDAISSYSPEKPLIRDLITRRRVTDDERVSLPQPPRHPGQLGRGFGLVPDTRSVCRGVVLGQDTASDRRAV